MDSDALLLLKVRSYLCFDMAQEARNYLNDKINFVNGKGNDGNWERERN